MLDSLYQRPPGAEYQRAIWGLAQATGAGSATTVSAYFTNRQQVPFMVATLSCNLTPGAAQYATGYSFPLLDPEAVSQALVGGGELLRTIAALITYLGQPVPQGTVIVPPRWQLGVHAQFNAGANSNAVAFRATGWYIPRGTLAFPS